MGIRDTYRMVEQGARRRGRPPDPTLRARIVAAAWRLFLQDGVESTPVEAIASEAHVSKVTLYRHFADKEALFAAGMEAERDRLASLRSTFAAAESTVQEPIEVQLRLFGEATMDYLTERDAVDFYAVLAGELRRHPQLAKSFYDVGPGQTHTALSALIRSAVEHHDLHGIDDPELAAEALFGAWQGFSNFQLSLGLDISAVRASARRRVHSAIDQFLALHASDRPTQAGP